MSEADYIFELYISDRFFIQIISHLLILVVDPQQTRLVLVAGISRAM